MKNIINLRFTSLLALCTFCLCGFSKPNTAQTQKSLYERIGGQPAIDATVEVFYKKVLADKRVSHFFKDINMKKQKAKQKAFIAAVLGGPKPWTGKNMRRAHDSLDIEGCHFDAIAENLQASLKDMKVPADLIAEVMTIVASTRKDVLNL